MAAASPRIPASRIVVIMPNWLGDAVMATPFLRALRDLYPSAHIAAIARPLVAPVLAGLPFVNDVHEQSKGEDRLAAAWMREQNFDLGILLPNSFRSAWTLFRARVKQRVGYARDRRNMLLTGKIRPQPMTPEEASAESARAVNRARIERWLKNGTAEPEPTFVDIAGNAIDKFVPKGFKPTPTIDYYLEIAKYLGAENIPRDMQLAITDAERAEADRALAQIENQKSKIENLIILVPGANFGAAKCWAPDRFASVAESLARPAGPFNATVLIATSPTEKPIADAILNYTTKHRDRIHALAALNNGKGISVGALKEIVRRSRLMICNDTGPRHFAAAFGIPAVTLFGPTEPIWAETFSPCETILRVPVPCGPCQLKQCPIDHRCMKGITVDMVLAAAHQLWNKHP